VNTEKKIYEFYIWFDEDVKLQVDKMMMKEGWFADETWTQLNEVIDLYIKGERKEKIREESKEEEIRLRVTPMTHM